MRDCCGCSPLCVHWPSFESLSRQFALDTLCIQRQEGGNKKGDKCHYHLNPFLNGCSADSSSHCLTCTPGMAILTSKIIWYFFFCLALQGRRQWNNFFPPVLFPAQEAVLHAGCVMTIPALWVWPFVLRSLSSQRGFLLHLGLAIILQKSRLQWLLLPPLFLLLAVVWFSQF